LVLGTEMAQTNFTPISLYYSTTAAAVPVNTNLVSGELAINITDGKLYYKDNSGVVQTIASKASGTVAGSNTQVIYNNASAYAGSANLTFNGTTLTAGGLAGPFNGTVGATTPSTGVFTTATARAAATQDSVILQGRAGGTNSYGVTLTPTTLTASRTVTFANADINFSTGLGVAQGGTGLTSGTSGGVLYYSATGTLASSAALAASALVVGGGAGVAPSTITTGTGVTTALGVNTGSTGAFVVNGGTALQIINTVNPVTVTSNAGTVPITYRINNFTNSSAATMTITLATASAVDGQMSIVRIYDFSAAAQNINWVNTENSTVTVPATSNGSITLPLTVGFMYNSQTSKWRCIASA